MKARVGRGVSRIACQAGLHAYHHFIQLFVHASLYRTSRLQQ